MKIPNTNKHITRRGVVKRNPPSWVDKHSVNCIKCGKLFDERDGTTPEDGEGTLCEDCADEIEMDKLAEEEKKSTKNNYQEGNMHKLRDKRTGRILYSDFTNVSGGSTWCTLSPDETSGWAVDMDDLEILEVY